MPYYRIPIHYLYMKYIRTQRNLINKLNQLPKLATYFFFKLNFITIKKK